MQTEQWFCPNNYCATEAWLVQQSADNDEVWFVTCRLNDATYTVAAVDPVCPRCGTTLCATLEIGQGGEVLEEGPMLDFVRSLR